MDSVSSLTRGSSGGRKRNRKGEGRGKKSRKSAKYVSDDEDARFMEDAD